MALALSLEMQKPGNLLDIEENKTFRKFSADFLGQSLVQSRRTDSEESTRFVFTFRRMKGSGVCCSGVILFLPISLAQTVPKKSRSPEIQVITRVLGFFSSVTILCPLLKFGTVQKNNPRHISPDYTENEEPHPQVEVALGFLITNCAPSSPSV